MGRPFFRRIGLSDAHELVTPRAPGCQRAVNGASALPRKAVSDAVHGLDVERRLWVELDLLPELDHVHVDGARRGVLLAPPDLVEDRRALERLALVREEEAQEFELAPREAMAHAATLQ